MRLLAGLRPTGGVRRTVASLRGAPHLLLFVCALLAVGRAGAQQIILDSSNVIGGSATYDSSNFNGGTFPAQFVVNDQTGTVGNDVFGGNYWLGPDGATGVYFVLDLGASTVISQIDLFNTHNDGFNDRSTNAFEIQASNSISFVSTAQGFALTAPTTILSGNLPFTSDPPADNLFTSANGLNVNGAAYEYLSFIALSYAGADGGTGAGAGLNEIRVSGATVPEPSTWAMIAGLATLALAFGQRARRSKA